MKVSTFVAVLITRTAKAFPTLIVCDRLFAVGEPFMAGACVIQVRLKRGRTRAVPILARDAIFVY